MASVTVLIYRIDTTYDTPTISNWNTNLGPVNITAGNHLHVIIDDTTFALSVEYRSSSTPGGGSYMGTLTEGPNLFFGYNGAATLLTASPYWQACDGTALRKIGVSSLFPYATLSFQEGAAECVVAPVCDLDFSPFYNYDHATGPVANDGFIRVFASSSNGPIKYALNDPDFDYATEGQTDNEFFNLPPNLYTVYAKDAAGCQDTIIIEIGITENYGVKYRFEFQDSLLESSKHHRVDILERAYEGAITEICGGDDDTLHVKWNGDPNDPNLALVPSELDLQILKEVAGTFTDLFTDDDRLFKIQHYVSDSNNFTGVPIYWTGYVIPEFHNEPWVFEPYYLDITATDGLAELKNLDFKDENDNLFKGDQKAIKIIAAVLKKADLHLNIRCGLNIFSEEMDTAATDDPLDQAYVDTRIFLSDKDEPIKCDEVIKKILEPFRATLCQGQGYWWIRRISDMVGTFAYREFDEDGEYDSNTTFAPTKDLKFPTQSNRAAWANKSARLSHLRNYGYFQITHDTGKDNNLIDEGRFEAEDIEEVSSGNQFFRNWNFFLAQAGAKFGHETVSRGNSTGAFFLDLNAANVPQAWNKLYSKAIDFSSGQGAVKIQFDYLVSPNFAGLPYITLGWSVKVTNGSESDWMKANFPPNFSRPSSDEIINEIYVTSFDTWQTFELTSYLLAVSAPATLQVTIYMHNHYGRDFDDIVDLKTFSISDLDVSLREGKKVMVGEDTKMYVYTSVADNSTAESLPDVVRPNDYASDYLWTLDKIVNIPPNVGLVNKFLIDNLSVSYFPYVVIDGRTTYIDPPATVSYSEETSSFIKSNFTNTVYLGDMPRFNDEYEDNERLIYRGYFRLSDGSPTTLWARAGVTESKKLLSILKDDVRDQFSQPARKLSGTFISDTIFHYVNSIQEHFEGSRYQIMTMDFNCKKAQYTVDIVKVRTAGDGEPPLETGAFAPEPFSESYE